MDVVTIVVFVLILLAPLLPALLVRLFSRKSSTEEEREMPRAKRPPMRGRLEHPLPDRRLVLEHLSLEGTSLEEIHPEERNLEVSVTIAPPPRPAKSRSGPAKGRPTPASLLRRRTDLRSGIILATVLGPPSGIDPAKPPS